MIIFNDSRLKENLDIAISSSDIVCYDVRIVMVEFFTIEPAYMVCELVHWELYANIKK